MESSSAQPNAVRAAGQAVMYGIICSTANSRAVHQQPQKDWPEAPLSQGHARELQSLLYGWVRPLLYVARCGMQGSSMTCFAVSTIHAINQVGSGSHAYAMSILNPSGLMTGAITRHDAAGRA